jgi:hypothetical protein
MYMNTEMHTHISLISCPEDLNYSFLNLFYHNNILQFSLYKQYNVNLLVYFNLFQRPNLIKIKLGHCSYGRK